MIKKHHKKTLRLQSLFLALLLIPVLYSFAAAETATISWNQNPEPDIYGYKVFYGTSSRNYTAHVDITGVTQTSAEIAGLEAGHTYYFAVQAVDLAGQTSDYSDEVTRTYDLPNVPPSAGFNALPETGIAPVAITFTSTSTDSDGSITSSSWNFGDGNTGTGTTVEHTFNTAGTYTVILTVQDNTEATDQASMQVTIAENQVPTASIDMDTAAGFAPVTVNFSASDSTDPDGSITDYAWNFGDGTNSGGETAVHTYETPGTYTVTLNVTDDKGGQDSATVQVEIKQGHTYTWTLGNSSTSDLDGTCADTYLNVNAENYATSDTLRTYTWPTDTAANVIIMKWDMSALPVDADIQSATLELYLAEAGGDDPYEIGAHRIIGLDPVIDACTGETWNGSDSWTNAAPLARDNIDSAVSVTAVNAVSGFKAWDITDIARQWVDLPAENFGVLLNADVTAASDSYRYFASSQASDATLRPRLTITFITEQQPDLPPRAEASADILAGKAPLTVNFSAAASHDAENNMSFAWDFGDSTSGSGISAAHEYTTPGTYQAVLTVTDGAGQTDTASLSIEVTTNQPPVASAQADITNGEAPLTVLFDAGTSSDSDGTITTYSWDFNSDGVEDAQGMTVDHTFTQAGDYHVQLTVTDDSGATGQDGSIVITVTSNAPPEITGFTATPAVLNNPGMEATFNATITDPENDTVTLLVDFGNGQTAAALPAVCTYDQTGTYNVTLTADDGNGNQTTASVTVEVNDAVPATPFNINVE